MDPFSSPYRDAIARADDGAERPLPPSYAFTLTRLDARAEDFFEYASGVRGYSPTSVANHRAAYRCFRTFLLQRTQDREAPIGANLFAVDAWMIWLKKSGTRRPITIHTYWHKLRTFFADLEARDEIPSPFRGLPSPPLPTRVPKALAPRECQYILDAAQNYPWSSDYDRHLAVAVFSMVLFAGLRRSDLLRVSFSDVDLVQGSIRISGGKGRGGGKDRVVFMGDRLRLPLQRYVRSRNQRRICAPEFFTCGRSGRGMSLITLRRLVVRVRRASGIPFTLHALRHSFITQLLRSGVPLHVASTMAGHTDLATTAGYLRVWDEDVRSAAKRLRYM